MKALFLLFLAALSPLLNATPSIGVATASPMTAAVGTPTQITVTASISDPSLIPNGANLLQLNANGSTTILGTLHDDGLNGDLFAGDLVFTVVVTLNAPSVTQIQLQVSAAFKGTLQRVKSPVMNVFFQSVSAPQQSLAALAQNLVAGNVTTALSYINSSGNATAVITSLSQQALSYLASLLNAATLVSSSPDSRIFQSRITRPDGTVVSMEFDMVPGSSGQWLINSW